jgi:hypothetical protein
MRDFYIQKKIIRTVIGIKMKVSCRELLRKFKFVHLSANSYCLLSFIADNREKYQTDSDIRNINTRHRYDLPVLSVLYRDKVIQ